MNFRHLSRYVPRRVLHVLAYIGFALLLVYFYVSTQRGKSKSYHDYIEDLKLGEDPFLEYRSLPKRDYFDEFAFVEEQRRVGLGEQGKAVRQEKDNDTIAKLRDDLYRQNGYDALVSDLIALNRSVKDIRHPACHGVKYIERLPTVSVIFSFHNEHFSTLLRSAYSVMNRSPPGVVAEVILVDDASTKPFLKEPLEDYWRAQHLDHIVKVVRTSKREGLIRARLVGAKAATAEVLVFLDAHSEANYNWLPPLVEPIALNYRTVVCPFVDVVDCDTFEYRAQDEGARGSFDWEFNYKRLPLTDADLAHPARPFRSPVMAGGYFAISAKWFWELGGYDEGLDIWGGEQYELSFKVWQCHGKLVDAPCSRVGHIYRCKYVPFPNPGFGDFISRNYKRVAEVWMDEYKHFLYERRPAMKTADLGNLDKQRAVRDRLRCKSFDWYMKEVAFDQNEFYPAVEPKDGANGELRNVAAGKCVDTRFKGTGERFGLARCESEMANEAERTGEQHMRLGFHQDIRPGGRTMCFDVSTSGDRAPVILFSCHSMRGNQWFKYRVDTGQLFHPVSNMCLDADPSTDELFMRSCDSASDTQRWRFTVVNAEVFDEWERSDKEKEERKRKNAVEMEKEEGESL